MCLAIEMNVITNKFPLYLKINFLFIKKLIIFSYDKLIKILPLGRMKSLTEIFKISEIFVQITNYLSDKDKIVVLFLSKTFNDNKELLKFESTYDFRQIYGKWCLPSIKNVFINGTIAHFDLKLGLELELELGLGISKFIDRSTIDPTLLNPTHIELTLCGNKINFHYTPYLLSLLDLLCLFRIENHDVVKKIISIIANKDEMLIDSCGAGYSKVAKLLMDAGADVHSQNDKAIIEASSYGHLHIIKLLKEWNKPPLMPASKITYNCKSLTSNLEYQIISPGYLILNSEFYSKRALNSDI